MNKNVKEIWNDIKSNKINYTLVDGGNQSDVYLYDKYAFKQGRKSEIKKDMNITKLAHKSSANIPRIIEYLKNENVVVYERIHGSKIRNLTHNEKINLAEDIGIQLKKFHSVEYDIYGEPDFSKSIIKGQFENKYNYINSVLNTFKNISKNSYYKKFVHDICLELENCIDTLPEYSTLCHGDIHISNLMYDGEKVYIIDFGDTTFGFSGTDVIEAYLNYYETSDYMAYKFLIGYGTNLDDLCLATIYQGILKRLYTRMWHEKYDDVPNWWNDSDKKYYNYRINRLKYIINKEFPIQI